MATPNQSEALKVTRLFQVPRFGAVFGIVVIAGIILGLSFFIENSPNRVSDRDAETRVLHDSIKWARSALSQEQQSNRNTTVAPKHEQRTLNGAEAHRQLQKEGGFDSLAKAFRSARYSVEELDPSAPSSRGAKYFASNPAHQLRVWFKENGIEFASGLTSAKSEGKLGTNEAIDRQHLAEENEEAWTLTLTLRAAGRANQLVEAGSRRVKAEANRVFIEDTSGTLTEWYENKSEGIEHGFTIQSAPSQGDGPLRVLMTVVGNLRAEMMKSQPSSGTPETAVKFARANGAEVLRYSGLRVWDASGQRLPARIELSGPELAFLVEDANARYPITIDPLFASIEARLTDDLEDTGDRFGSTVALKGDTALIGAPKDDTAAGIDTGSAYVFVRSGSSWMLQSKLLAADGAMNDFFGSAVALGTDMALVGAPNDNTVAGVNAGSAYLFVRNGTFWTLQSKLLANDSAANDIFGSAVALDTETALIGAPKDDTAAGIDAGSAYLFIRSGTSWILQSKLLANDGAANDCFGFAVALDTDTALIGAPNDDSVSGANAGSAYLFTRSGTAWTFQSKLLASNGTANDYFGSALALNTGTALVGAHEADTASETYVGSVYVFVCDGARWEEQALLSPSDGVSGDYFGYSVALSGDTALIGAPQNYLQDSQPVAFPGKAYLFVRSGTNWNQQTTLIASDGTANDFYGHSVALDGDTAVIGCSGDDTATQKDTGSVYLLTRKGSIWTPQAKLTARDETTGDSFGSFVALSGNTAILGVPRDDTPAGVNAGNAYVFARQGSAWRLEAKLTAANGAADDLFGYCVAIHGDTALVGALGSDTAAGMNVGSAYVFVRSGTTWSQEANLFAEDGKALDHFGYSVVLHGETALVGSPESDILSRANVGSAYVFARNGNTWTQQAKLVALDGAANDKFGEALSLDKDTAFVGCPADDTLAGADAGSVYVFQRSGSLWVQQARLTAQDGALDDQFGYSVAVNGDTAVIGAPRNNSAGRVDVGSAYVFIHRENGWIQQAKLTASDGNSFDNFGTSVALYGNTILTGSVSSDTPTGVASGSAYLFARDGITWAQQTKFTSGIDSSKSDFFGLSVALENGIALVGAPEDDASGYNAGSVYAFLVGELPQITSQPQSRTVVPGTNVTFSATVTGFKPLRYQWRKNGFEIAGANGVIDSNAGSLAISYTVPAVTKFDAGGYDVVVSNIGGTATSAVAILGVNALSDFSQTPPAPANEARGFITVRLSPAGIGAAWRFVGEQQWRAPGVPVGGLTSSDREIEFRPVPGYLHPLREPVQIVSGEAPTEIEREYYETNDGAVGTLTVFLKPDSLSSSTLPPAERAQWRLLGEDDSKWRNSGATFSGLPVGSYLVECKPLQGRSTPPALSVSINAETANAATATYFLADSAIGTRPKLVPFENINTPGASYAFTGQLRSEVGSSTGFVVKPRVVATAAHAVFDDVALSAATGLQWLFQRDSLSYELEPQIPRGFYVFQGYAAQRANEATPGESSPASQNLDVAALYFSANAGRGGSGGYLASEAEENEWLLSDRLKILTGYPVDGIAPENQGRLHTTVEANVRFSKSFGRTYTTSDITSTGGTSGGPLCVRYDDGKFYPAAIYLGGSAQTVVRAIDSDVIELFRRAEISANTGQNNTGGGYDHVDAPAGANAIPFATLQVNLSPAGAVAAGARWKLGPNGKERLGGVQLSSLSPGNYTIYFLPLSGYISPAPKQVALKANQVITVQGTYLPPPRITSPGTLLGTRNALTFEITTVGSAANIELTGELPLGLTFDSTTSQITGTPRESGRFPVLVRATNTAGSDTQLLTIRIAPQLDSQVAVVSRGQELRYQIETADSAISYSVDPASLPAGLSFDTANGILTGTPAASGTFQIPISITNSGGIGSATLTVHVRPMPDGVNERSGRIDQPFVPFRITSQDSVTSFTASNLPPGLSIDPGTGLISGTPTSSGIFDAAVGVSNDAGTGTLPIRFVIEAVLRVTTSGKGQIPAEFKGATLHLPGEQVSITATPDRGYFFAGWSGGSVSSESLLNITMTDRLELQANFISFAEVQGVYTGLVSSESPSFSTTGIARVILTRTGAVTGALLLEGKTYILSRGAFQGMGKLSGRFSRKAQPPLSVALQLRALDGPAQIHGIITIDGTSLNLVLNRAVFDGRRNRAPQIGDYTLKLTRPDVSPVALSHGYGTAKVSASGNVRFVGLLGDGTPIGQSAILSGRGTWPFFIPLPKGRGVVAGELAFRERTAISDVDGTLAWFPPAKPTDSSAAPAIEMEVIGSRYATSAIDYRDLTVSFIGGGLATPTPQTGLSFNPRSNTLQSNVPIQVRLIVVPRTGFFRGAFVPPGSIRATAVSGVLLQKSHTGAGLFLGTKRTFGTVELNRALAP